MRTFPYGQPTEALARQVDANILGHRLLHQGDDHALGGSRHARAFANPERSMSQLAQWVFLAMVTLMPPRQNDVPRLRELVIIAIVTADAAEATPLPGKTPKETAAALTGIAVYESGFVIAAHGSRSEVSPWQILPPAPVHLRAQAGEAIRRLRIQGWAGYTGEANYATHPLADHRRAKAEWLLANVP
jgi:hypothetical protein